MNSSARNLEGHTRALAETFSPRDSAHPRNLDRAAAYIKQAFERAGGKPAEQVFSVEGKEYRNVIVRFGPAQGARIVIGAHYDAVRGSPGADDNASGVAGLLELARLLGQEPPTAPVELVAYSLEEPPYFGTAHMGSVVHARSLKQSGVKVRAMFSLEMLGYFSSAPKSQDFPSPALRAFYPSEGNFIGVVGKLGQSSLVNRVKRAMRAATPLPVHAINAPPGMTGIDFSDHRSY